MAKGGKRKIQQKEIQPTVQKPQVVKVLPETIAIKKDIVKASTQKQAPIQMNKKNSRFPLSVAECIAVLFGVAVLFAFLLPCMFALGVGHNEEVQTLVPVTLSNTNTASPVAVVDTVQLLSGEEIEKSQARFPVAVMIDNHSSARPQSGIQSASLVYESLVEGSITRFMAIFEKGTQEKIGPVRSSRPYYLMYWDAIDGPYMHAGGSPEALLKIRQLDVKDVNSGKYYWRVSDRPAPHNLYTSSSRQLFMLRDTSWGDAARTYSTWKFSDAPARGVEAGESVDLYFSGRAEGSHVRFVYDDASVTYKRFQSGVAHQDAETKEQIAVKTVIVKEIPPIAGIGDHGRLTLTVTGEGKAHILFGGKRIIGTWKKSDSAVRETFYDDAGNEIIFPKGPIWVEVMPNDHDIAFE